MAVEIPRRETIRVEFKSDRKGYSDDGLVDEIVGMANSEGGTLFLGVEDDGEVSGLSAKHQDPIGLTALVGNKTVPPVSVRAEIVNVEGKDVMLIEVPRSPAVTASSSGRIMRRRPKVDGTPENVPMYPYEITSRLSDLGRLDFSARPLDASLDDLDPNQMARLRSSIQNRNGDKALLELSDEELAKALRLAVDMDGALRPTMTGLLLVGKAEAIQQLVPTMRADFQVLEGTQVRVNESFTMPILEVIELFTDYLKPWNPEGELEHGPFRLPVPVFSRPAFREGLVNAFAHRDYAVLGSVRVLIDDDGLTVSSPGGFIDGVSLDNLLTVEPHGRNPCLSDVLKRIGLAERTGRGIDRIFEGAITLGRPWPDYSESTARNVVLFMPRAAADLAFVKALAEEQDRRGRPLSINQLLVLSLLRREGPMNAGEISGTTHIAPVRLKNILTDMAEDGLLSVGEGPRSNAFALGRRVLAGMGEPSKTRRSANDTESALSDIMRLAETQGGSVCKADIMERLRVGPNRAYEYLRLLQGQGKLEIVTRGKYAKYRLSGR